MLPPPRPISSLFSVPLPSLSTSSIAWTTVPVFRVGPAKWMLDDHHIIIIMIIVIMIMIHLCKTLCNYSRGLHHFASPGPGLNQHQRLRYKLFRHFFCIWQRKCCNVSYLGSVFSLSKLHFLNKTFTLHALTTFVKFKSTYTLICW